MRPIRLEIEGFTCYRDRQPPLEFSDLSLFAISGPTGAGKSSILDTMLYALYGQVPRLGKQGITEVISHGRDVLSVCLDFEVRGSRYRVARRLKRKSKGPAATTATLAELTAGAERSIADGVKQVNEEVVRLLGLAYDDFIQTVILPQGEFARFLRAKPGDQRAILQHLLRHEVFERMRAAAEERRRDLETRLRSLDAQLTMCEGATGEALAARAAELAEAQALLAAALSAREAAETELQDVRRQHQLTEQVQQLREQRRALEADAEDVERGRAELENARRAAAVLPRLEALEDAARAAAGARRDRDAAAAALARASVTRRTAGEQLEAAAAAAGDCDEFLRRIRCLDEIAGDIERRGALSTTLQAIPEQLAIAESARQAAVQAATVARGEVRAHEARVQSLVERREALPFDEALHSALEAVRDEIARARSLRRERDDAAGDEEERCRAESAARVDEAAAETAHRVASERAEAAARALHGAEAAAEDGRSRHRAAALRAHLHAGESCPVCLQTVTSLPAAEAPPELAVLDAASAKAEQRARKADAARQGAAEALAGARARRAAAEQGARAAASKARERGAAFAAAMARLAGAIAGAAALDDADLLAWMEQQAAQWREVKTERDRVDSDVRRAELDLAHARLALAAAETTAGNASGRRNLVVAEQARLQSELADIVARIERVSSHVDPRAERDELDRRVRQLREADRDARELFTGAQIAVAQADECARAAEARLAAADAHRSATLAGLADALEAAGFDGAEHARTAVRDRRAQDALQARVSRFDERRAGVLQRLLELEPQVAGREVSATMLAEVERRCAAAGCRWREADQAVTRLDGDCTRLRGEVQRRAQLLAGRSTQQGAFDVTAELAADLKGDRFQEYLLEEAFRTLVAGASLRMKAISNRYTLQWDAGEFFVVDHDNAGERRRAETLSGGETFMASLCLALQLGEEVLRSSGALQMDSLFIDEGFGTLDADSLSEVTDAIEALRQDGGRLIGVISHRPELTDRLPGCIRVQKGVGESRWMLERAG